jgi:hypothetical protein
MNRNEVIALLAYIQVHDKRTVGAEDVDGWLDVLPRSLDLSTAHAAVKMFFGEAAAKPDEKIFFSTRHLLHYAARVRRQRELEAAKEAAKRPAITQRTKPPKGGWRSLLPEHAPRMTEKHDVRTGPAPVINYGDALKAP